MCFLDNVASLHTRFFLNIFIVLNPNFTHRFIIFPNIVDFLNISHFRILVTYPEIKQFANIISFFIDIMFSINIYYFDNFHHCYNNLVANHSFGIQFCPSFFLKFILNLVYFYYSYFDILLWLDKF
jgi:hypothetical protein